MTKLLTLGVAALTCACSIATAQSDQTIPDSDPNDYYSTIDEKMDVIHKEVVELTAEFANETGKKNRASILKEISHHQKSLLDLKREKGSEGRYPAPVLTREMALFNGDLTKKDLDLKSFETTLDAESDELNISFKTIHSNCAQVTVLTPGKEIVHLTNLRGTKGKFSMSMKLPDSELTKYCVNISADGKSYTKVISL